MTSRSLEAVVAEFLRNVLASDALGGPKLEARARAAGLLGEGQRITHAKVFKRTKKFLGIKSVRNGFGDGGEWLWRLERRPASPVSITSPHPDQGLTTALPNGGHCGAARTVLRFTLPPIGQTGAGSSSPCMGLPRRSRSVRPRLREPPRCFPMPLELYLISQGPCPVGP